MSGGEEAAEAVLREGQSGTGGSSLLLEPSWLLGGHGWALRRQVAACPQTLELENLSWAAANAAEDGAEPPPGFLARGLGTEPGSSRSDFSPCGGTQRKRDEARIASSSRRGFLPHGQQPVLPSQTPSRSLMRWCLPGAFRALRLRLPEQFGAPHPTPTGAVAPPPAFDSHIGRFRAGDGRGSGQLTARK
jgi:hypothetical protein